MPERKKTFQSAETDAPGGGPAQILLVDDNPVFLQIAEDFLKEQGENRFRTVGKARTAREAVALAGRLQPDLVLLDISLPDRSGLTILRELHEAAPSARVVILTMYNEDHYRAAAEAGGAAAFITKAEMNESLMPALRRALAAEAPSSEAPKPAGIPAASSPQPMKKILVVDDSATMRRMVITALQSVAGAEFEEAGSGLEALERLALGPIHLMILDINMPDMHGIEVLRFLRSHEKYRSLPVIVLTTRARDEDRDQAMKAGATLYLTKPFKPNEIARAVQDLLQQ